MLSKTKTMLQELRRIGDTSLARDCISNAALGAICPFTVSKVIISSLYNQTMDLLQKRSTVMLG